MKLQGRLFMTIAFTLTACVGGVYLMVTAPSETKIGVFGMIFGLATAISKDYFNRSDRPDKGE